MIWRIFNELRLIFWPWFLIIFAGLAPAIKPALADKRAEWPDAIAVFGFFGGTAILTALSFRAAPRHPSSEPLTNKAQKIWAEKMVCVSLAVLSAGLIA